MRITIGTETQNACVMSAFNEIAGQSLGADFTHVRATVTKE
jgi:hypothetical protein